MIVIIITSLRQAYIWISYSYSSYHQHHHHQCQLPQEFCHLVSITKNDKPRSFHRHHQAKTALDMEIAVYRKLVECEEDRLGITASEAFVSYKIDDGTQNGQGEEKAKSLVVYYREEGGRGGGWLLRKKHPNNDVFWSFLISLIRMIIQL